MSTLATASAGGLYIASYDETSRGGVEMRPGCVHTVCLRVHQHGRAIQRDGRVSGRVLGLSITLTLNLNLTNAQL